MTSATITKKINQLEERLYTVEKLVRPQTKRNILQETAGLLRGRLKGDPVSWQRRIRRQWTGRTELV